MLTADRYMSEGTEDRKTQYFNVKSNMYKELLGIQKRMHKKGPFKQQKSMHTGNTESQCVRIGAPIQENSTTFREIKKKLNLHGM